MRKWKVPGMTAAAVALSAVMSVSAVPYAVYAEAAEAVYEDEEEQSSDDASTEEDAEELPDGVEPEGEESEETEEERQSATYTSEEFPFYFMDMDHSAEYPLYFVNGVEDLPYVNLADWAQLMVDMFSDDQGSYKLSMEIDEDVAMLTRENGYSMIIDFAEEKIYFEDYDLFIHNPGESSLLDIVADLYTDEDGNPSLIEKIKQGSFDRYGKEIELDLAAYQIPLYWNTEDSIYLIPMQTLSDFLISISTGRTFVYNTKAVYYGGASDFGFGSSQLTPFGESYVYSAPSNMLSEELAWYSYCELCLALDNLYGLKEIHDISSFDSIFTETGYRSDLASTDPNVKDGALLDFINYYLDDMHSGFDATSYLTDSAESIGGDGLSALRDSEVGQIYYNARTKADHEIPAYEEVGNTAYITFDHFLLNSFPAAYYAGEVNTENDPESETMETPALIIYAHEQITRENSPIENVVIDLSLNGGGDVDAAAAVAAWYLGEASMSIRSSLTGAISTGTYRFDTNLDGVFDDSDTVQDKNLYCLIGPYSFSCGNLVPNIFRSSKRVTLIGKESGGGSCSVLPMSTAYGSLFRISSPSRMSYLKNGSYYDTDTGIMPDFIIAKPDNFYNRETLTEYINQLY